MGALRLVESFLSIQGEGKFQGRAAIFLRFAGCNLNCAGFGVRTKSKKTGETLIGCDTARAVFTGHFSYEILSAEQIIARVERLCDGLNFKPVVVFTGGEPLLYAEDQNFVNLLEGLDARNFEIHFETNGTIEVNFAKFPVYKKCKFALGVKLANSGVSEAKRINPAALASIIKNAADGFYKFVLKDPRESDLEQILQVLKIARAEVWCMPMGADAKELAQNARSVADFAIKHGFNYSERIHVRLWDKKEGV